MKISRFFKFRLTNYFVSIHLFLMRFVFILCYPYSHIFFKNNIGVFIFPKSFPASPFIDCTSCMKYCHSDILLFFFSQNTFLIKFELFLCRKNSILSINAERARKIVSTISGFWFGSFNGY